MGIAGLSAHKSGGWRAQWDRTHRWYERVKRVGRDSTALPADRLDFLLAFFQNCYALRDWIQKDGTACQAELDMLMSGSKAL